MKVLNLRCTNGHGFEGWYGSEDEFLQLNGASQIECPVCTDRAITRLPSAPRLNLSGSREPAAPARAADPHSEPAAAMQAAWLAAARRVLANTEDVGTRFAEEARRIHYGEAKARGIRGLASPEERAALVDEGIEVMPLPIPDLLKDPVQ